MNADIALRPYLPSDAATLAGLFVASVETLASEDYDVEQIAAWTSAADDAAAFAARLSGQLTLVATLDAEPVGFASMKGQDEIDLLYVHPEAARMGVATTLCDALEKLARARGAQQLSVDSSDTAEPFFAQRGYSAWRRNTVEIEDVWLATTTMKKPLAANDSPPRAGS
ncbi:MAG: GCN5-related N-acetyltransferase:Aminotransferase, class-II [Hyphomicrobiales bacterium]|jgi:putative acetyltransferase|nr:GCN5-related N-acetyltransferase:Aminotransferase, class-II [Hyphomicrobiales bacterium]